MAFPGNQQGTATATSNMPQPQHFHQTPTYYDEQGRPRAQTGFSVHSRKSSGSTGKIEESHAEKEQQRLHSKADPSVAMNEAEPAAVAALQATSMSPLRAIQHKDGLGNVISDPDKSNPTRSRWERPLDTIRAFEAAVDGNTRTKSMYRTETPDTMSNYGGHSRRTSYYGNQTPISERPSYGGNSHYGRSQSYRPDSQYMGRPDSYYNNNGYGGGYGGGQGGGQYDVGPGGYSNGYAPNRSRVPRTSSEPYVQYNMAGGQGGQYGMPSPGYPQPYDNMSGSGSASTPEPAGYSTDPSSENSSVDRIAPSHTLNPREQQQDPYASGYGSPNQNQGGYGGMGGGDMHQQQQYNAAQRMGDGYLNQSQSPAVPQQQQMNSPPAGQTIPRVPIKLSGAPGGQAQAVQAEEAGEKRKSWFNRRFSRS